VNDEIRSLISDRPPTESLKKAAIASGMKSLLNYGVGLVLQGITTIEEIERVIFA
jgi:type IV pilus assembly protein PilB